MRKGSQIFTLVTIFIMFLVIAFPEISLGADKPETIRTVNILDLTGPYAPVTGPLAPGLEDAWKYINTELGGVHGVKVDSITKDFAGKMPLGLSMYNEAITMQPKPLFVTPGSSPLGAALRERIKEDNLICVTATSNEAIYPLAHTFGVYPLYVEMAALGVKYLKDNWKENRPLRIGIITWDTGYGRAIITDEFMEYAKSIGVEIVGTEVFGIREADVTSQLLRLREKKADWLLSNLAASGAVGIKKGCKTMGWDINLYNCFVTEWGTVNLAPPLFQGDITTFPVKSFDETDDPSIQKVIKFFNANNRTIKDKSVFYLIGWQTALVEHHVMKTVVDKHGWNGFNTKNLIEELSHLTEFKPLDGLSEVTYSPGRYTMRKARLYKIKDTQVLPLTDFLEVLDMRPKEYR